jgi:hypothetical protein
MVATPNGKKSKRFIDVVGKDENGNVVEAHQIGQKTKKSGAPISRERQAIEDIERDSPIKVEFDPYN